MGKKNKNRADNDDDEFKEGDFSTKFVSNKAAVAKEMAEAQRPTHHDDSDEGANKKQRKRKGAANELDDEFEPKPTKEQKAKKTKVVAAGDSDHEIDLQKEIEENFEGVSKKNTRKKKKDNTNIYAGQDDLAGAFADDADEDEMYSKKGGKQQKEKKHQGKKNKKKQDDSDPEDEPKDEPKDEPEEEVKEKPNKKDAKQKKEGKQQEPQKKEEEPEEVEEKEFPISMIYCGKCGLPPEYCEFGQKDISACKEWLAERYPQMYTEIYKEEAKPKPAAEAPKPKEGEEEKKVDDEEKEGEGEEEGEKKQPKKKVKFGKDPNNIGVITVYKQKRGGNKIVSQIVGFEHYTKDLKALASKFGKKFSCGCNLATDEIHGECISVQGDVEDRLLDLMEQDKELIAMNVPFEKIKFVEDGNKKGRKRPGPAKPSE